MILILNFAIMVKSSTSYEVFDSNPICRAHSSCTFSHIFAAPNDRTNND